MSRSKLYSVGMRPTTFPDTHGSPLLGMAWTALGALCRDGTFYYQPNRDNNPQDYAANPRLSASAITALILSAKHKQLQMTGAKPVQVE